MSPAPRPREFYFIMIKPTHDDDGYPIQWLRSALPSNTLACLNGLAEGARRQIDIDQQATGRLAGKTGLQTLGLSDCRP
ncbi:MAG: hypothetical protein QNJ04_03450 [Desulfobacterales bacterium]|nr:hypothetical protein [Desulfobacterales bacterium]